MGEGLRGNKEAEHASTKGTMRRRKTLQLILGPEYQATLQVQCYHNANTDISRIARLCRHVRVSGAGLKDVGYVKEVIRHSSVTLRTEMTEHG